MRPDDLRAHFQKISSEVITPLQDAKDKNLCKAHDLRGYIQLKRKLYFEADNDYEKAIKICREYLEEMLPDDDNYQQTYMKFQNLLGDFYSHRGYAHLKNHQLKNAVMDLDRAIKI